MFNGLFASIPLIHVYTHQHSNEVLRGVADVVPVGGVELKLACGAEEKADE